MNRAIIFMLLLLMPAGLVFAQEAVPEQITTVRAKVLEILDQEVKTIPGTDTTSLFQTVHVKILEGAEKGKEITVENDYLKLNKDEVFYLRHVVDTLGDRDYYSVSDPYRLPAIYLFTGLFILCVLIFGGWQGIRGLLSLALSLFFIFFLLFPGILAGYSPVLVSIGVASIIIILGSYVTHGFNKTTTSAVFGMIGSILFTGLLAHIAINYAQLSGFNSEESIYLNFNTRGAIDFVGLLLGGMLIGLLGVLYDAAIAQAIAVEELHKVGPHLPRKFIFARAIRMGREHIGALVNTLAIAYVGVSLPLLLLFYSAGTDLAMTVNREIFATEIIRTMIGSIGLVIAVPITTLVSVFMLVKKDGSSVSEEKIESEKEKAEHIGHAH